jgi:TIR domain
MGVFVSYSSRDKDAVATLTKDLQEADEQVWLDQRLAGGDAWWKAILEQLRSCDVFIFALSQNSINSKPCQAELQYARALGLPILPVQVGHVDSMQLNPLAAVQSVDYRTPTPQAAMRLISALNRERASRQPLPSPLPDEPAVPFEYLIRLYTTISGTDYLSPPDQATLIAQIQFGLREDGEHDAARNDIIMLLTKLHDREDVTYRTRTDVEAILASIGTRSTSPATPAPPPVGAPTHAAPAPPERRIDHSVTLNTAQSAPPPATDTAAPPIVRTDVISLKVPGRLTVGAAGVGLISEIGDRGGYFSGTWHHSLVFVELSLLTTSLWLTSRTLRQQRQAATLSKISLIASATMAAAVGLFLPVLILDVRYSVAHGINSHPSYLVPLAHVRHVLTSAALIATGIAACRLNRVWGWFMLSAGVAYLLAVLAAYAGDAEGFIATELFYLWLVLLLAVGILICRDHWASLASDDPPKAGVAPQSD